MRPAILYPLFTSIDQIAGIGPKTAKLFSKLMGDHVMDVLFHLPNNVLDRTQPPFVIAKVTVLAHEKPYSAKQPYKILCQLDDGRLLDIVFFNYRKDYLAKQLPEGKKRLISGSVEYFGARMQMSHPDYIVGEDEAFKIPKLEPIYPLAQGITNKMVERTVRESLKFLPPNMPEWLDAEFLRVQKWPGFNDAVKKVHHPQKPSDTLPNAIDRQRLAYDEMLANQLALVLMRAKMKKLKGQVFKGTGELEGRLLNNLPFELTNAQKRSFLEIKQDMESPFRMLRLLQGDVGSGKTVVAVMAMLNAVESGAQAAIMAPTDILVRQHYDNISAMCQPLGLSTVLLTGREKGKARTDILDRIADGRAQIIIGTHALFQSDVAFQNLGLTVIDEQHRFGVEQRLLLTQKGNMVDILVMTATPIPRTLALTYYGDMDISKIDEKPPTRQPVDTRVMPLSKIAETTEKLRRAIAAGNQVYWVCPLIEETEKSDLANATTRFNALQESFPNRVGLLHGKMKGSEKDAIMQDFIDKKIDILVSTTVIEVGVDVPSATIMIIEQAERFGLSTLHQLRGRIGRGSKKSVCLLLYNDPLTENAKKRLQILRHTEDGFLIAEEDLNLRGAGEVLGSRQSGFQEFHLADLSVHAHLLSIARDDALLILRLDPDLKSDRGQALRVLLYLFNKDAEIKTILSG